MIRVGIGGWTFAPWHGTFYPKGLAQKRELEYASRHLTSIEINGTYYGSQKPESFARWREETPEGFVFALKGPRFTTNRRILAEAGSSIERFFSTGVMNLKEKLGPVNWQFLPAKRFDPADFEAFLKLLPKSIEGRKIRHVVEVRHEGFRTAEFVDLLRAYKTGVVLTDKDEFPVGVRLYPPAARVGGREERLSGGGARYVGAARVRLVSRTSPGRPRTPRRSRQAATEVAGRVHLLHQWL